MILYEIGLILQQIQQRIEHPCRAFFAVEGTNTILRAEAKRTTDGKHFGFRVTFTQTEICEMDNGALISAFVRSADRAFERMYIDQAPEEEAAEGKG